MRWDLSSPCFGNRARNVDHYSYGMEVVFLTGFAKAHGRRNLAIATILRLVITVVFVWAVVEASKMGTCDNPCALLPAFAVILAAVAAAVVLPLLWFFSESWAIWLGLVSVIPVVLLILFHCGVVIFGLTPLIAIANLTTIDPSYCVGIFGLEPLVAIVLLFAVEAVFLLRALKDREVAGREGTS